jgi:hypothetical protein
MLKRINKIALVIFRNSFYENPVVFICGNFAL